MSTDVLSLPSTATRIALSPMTNVTKKWDNFQEKLSYLHFQMGLCPSLNFMRLERLKYSGNYLTNHAML